MDRVSLMVSHWHGIKQSLTLQSQGKKEQGTVGFRSQHGYRRGNATGVSLEITGKMQQISRGGKMEEHGPKGDRGGSVLNAAEEKSRVKSEKPAADSASVA